MSQKCFRRDFKSSYLKKIKNKKFKNRFGLKKENQA